MVLGVTHVGIQYGGGSANSFRSRLDKFWCMHVIVYDYTAHPLATGRYV